MAPNSGKVQQNLSDRIVLSGITLLITLHCVRIAKFILAFVDIKLIQFLGGRFREKIGNRGISIYQTDANPTLKVSDYFSNILIPRLNILS